MQCLGGNSHRVGMDLLVATIQPKLDLGEVMPVYPDVGVMRLVLVLAADPIDARGTRWHKGAVVGAVSDFHHETHPAAATAA